MKRLGKEKELTSFKSVEKWFVFRTSSPTTRKGYISRFGYFLKITKIDPDKLVEEWKNVRYDPIEKQKFIDRVAEIVEEFYTYIMKRKTLTELTKKHMYMVVKSFLKFHKIPLEIDEPVLKPTVTYHNRDIVKQEVRRILEASSLRERLFFLMMAESGMRPDTLTKLQYRHIKEEFEAEKVPMKIELPSQLLKDRVGDRFTFIGEDAFNLLKTYLSTMKLKDDDYLFQPEKKTGKNEPIPPTSFSNYFRKIAVKLGITEARVKGRPYPIRLYCLRKYFRNNCKADTSFREFWMGHTLDVDEHYFTRDVETHRREYAKAYDSLRVYEPPLASKFLSPEEFRKVVIDYLKTEEGQKLLSETIKNTLIPTGEILRKIFEAKS
jgi:integrase